MRETPARILVLGGYGTFGGRLVRLIAAHADGPTLLVAGRSRERAAAFCATLPDGADAQPLAFDRTRDLAPQLEAAAPHLVVDASGPFQTYGEGPYAVVEACLSRGIDYIDIADASGFVCGIGRFDEAARQKGIFALSGASTCPALTDAALRHLAQDLRQVDGLEAGIAPSPLADVGESVVRAIATYAGKPIRLLRGGREAVAYGLIDSRRFTIRPPGALPLPRMRFSSVDVPDLRLLSQVRPELGSVFVGAGLRPGIRHRLVTGLASLVRTGLLGSLAPFGGILHRAGRRLRWGEARGGMYVALRGREEDGQPAARSWYLIAEGEDGLFVPAMAAAALISRCRRGSRPAPGARPAVGEVELSDLAPFFAEKRIRTGRRNDLAAGRLYRRILGDAWETLPESVRQLHEAPLPASYSGRAQVERGRGLLSRAVAALVGFPAPGQDIPVNVCFEARQGREIWTRTFGTRSFRSSQGPGRGQWEGLIVERFGPVAVGLALVVEGQRLRIVVRRWSVLGLPLPLALAPGGETFEEEEDGRFRFDVEIAHPFTGPVVRYRGSLIPDS